MNKIDALKKYIFAEMSKHEKLEGLNKIDTFIKSLNKEQIDFLANYLSKIRHNCVYKKILQSKNVYKSEIPISQIEIGKINEFVNPLLEQINFRLSRVLEDDKICTHKEFNSDKNDITKLDERLSVFIAEKTVDKYKLIDGNHRAINLVSKNNLDNLALIILEMGSQT